MPDGLKRRPIPDNLPSLEGVHPVLARTLAARGVSSSSQLSHSLEQLLPPSQLKGLDEAARLLADTLAASGSIVVVGDFDADGATSSALAVSMLKQMGATSVDYLVPNRFDFGYGLTPEIVELASQRQPSLIVTVDNGISSLSGVELAGKLGIQTLVTDHHLPGAQLPVADVIVNPSQPGCEFPSKNLAGVGVIFYVMLALRGELRKRNWFSERGIPEPNLASVLDLVALGTVADVVPLDHNNRIMIQQGLLRIRAGECRPGIRALFEISGRNRERAVSSDLAFALAPRLNAAGRLDDMSAGIACLLTEDEAEARQLAADLDALNRDRRQIEQGMQEQALATLREIQLQRDDPPAALCLFDPGWHQGVVGIVASRIKDRLHRPVIAFARSDSGTELKGSARSVSGLHIRDLLERVNSLCPGLIIKFGGHAMAAGLSLEESRLEEFQQQLLQVAGEALEQVELDASLLTDGELDASDFVLGLAKELRYATAWGQHFPEPLFEGIFQIVHQRLVGEKHLKLVLAHPDNSNRMVDAIAFNVDLEQWPDQALERVRVAFRLDCNYFRGEERLQLAIEYLEKPA